MAALCRRLAALRDAGLALARSTAVHEMSPRCATASSSAFPRTIMLVPPPGLGAARGLTQQPAASALVRHALGNRGWAPLGGVRRGAGAGGAGSAPAPSPPLLRHPTIARRMSTGAGNEAASTAGATRGSPSTLITPFDALLVAVGGSFCVYGFYTGHWMNVAARRGYVPVVELLIAAGADVNKISSSGITPLFYAIVWGHADVVARLLAAGANVHKTCTDGAIPPLSIAAAEGHVDIVEMLLASGADVNQANQTFALGSTPLCTAAHFGHVDVVGRLIAAGADVKKARSDGTTALSAAREGGHTDVAQMLRAAGA